MGSWAGVAQPVVYRVAVRGGEGLALLAAAGGALAVSHQLEHRLATNSVPASRAAQSAGGSVDRLRNRAARAEGRTAAACHTARGIPEPNRAYGHYSHTRADAADSSLATFPLSSRVSCTASRVSRTGTLADADAHPADLASPSVDSLKSANRATPRARPQGDR